MRSRDYKIIQTLELDKSIPRAIPEEVKLTRLYSTRNKAFYILLLLGSLATLSAYMPVIVMLSEYILPLGYLDWIGASLILLSIINFKYTSTYRKALKYITHSKFIDGTVLDLIKSPSLTQNGQPTNYAIYAHIEFINPINEKAVIAEVKSKDFSVDEKDNINTNLIIGDTVPLVFHSNDINTINILEFIEILPGFELDRLKESSLISEILKVLAVVLIVAILLWNLIATNIYEPINFNWASFFIPTVVTHSIIVITTMFLIKRKRKISKQIITEANTTNGFEGKAIEIIYNKTFIEKVLINIIAPLGLLLFLLFTTTAFAFTLNAYLDNSSPTYEEVQFIGSTQTTRNFIFREYSIEYTNLVRNITDDRFVTLEFLESIKHENGKVIVNSGRFGWDFVSGFELPKD